MELKCEQFTNINKIDEIPQIHLRINKSMDKCGNFHIHKLFSIFSEFMKIEKSSCKYAITFPKTIERFKHLI